MTDRVDHYEEEEILKVSEKQATTFAIRTRDFFPERILEKQKKKYGEKLGEATMEIHVFQEAYAHELVESDVDTKVTFWLGVQGYSVLYEAADFEIYCAKAEVDAHVERLVMALLGDPSYWEKPFRSLAENE